MIPKQLIVLSLLIIALQFNYGTGIRTKDKMYEAIQGSKACFRRLNATHQVGCTSKRGGSTGVIHFCRDQADLDFIMKNGTAGPYIPVMPAQLFTLSNLNRFKSNDKIAGLLLYVDRQRPDYFSHENQCPNTKFNVENTCTRDFLWNPRGTGLLYQDIPFPVFYVEGAEYVQNARDCFEQFNNFSFDTQRQRSLCSLQLTSFMAGATNAPTCLRRSNSIKNLNPVRFCDALGDENIWASLFPLVKGQNFSVPIKDFSYIVITARMDTTSFFDKTAGAISPVTGLVALLTTAKLLKTMLPQNSNYDKNVLFLLFNGESYDYIGSQRFLYDMLKGDFPVLSGDGSVLPKINVKDLVLWVELSQLSNTGTVVAHNYARNDNATRRFIHELSANKGGLTLHESTGTLPPASLHTFVKNLTGFPGVVLADHSGPYANHYYNSIFDNASNIDYHYFNTSADTVDDIPADSIQKFIANVSEVVAKAVYQEIVGRSYVGNKVADIQFVDELFYCYLENTNCRVHQAVKKQSPNQPPSLYIGVEIVSNHFTSRVGRTLAWVTGDDVGKGDANCTNQLENDRGIWRAFKYYNFSTSLDDLNTTVCYRSNMNYTEAKSPAFIIDGYDWSSGQYSTWTESTWNDFRIRIFLKPSAAHENMTIALGSVVMIFSFVFVYFVKIKSDVLFAPSIPTLAPTNC